MEFLLRVWRSGGVAVRRLVGVYADGHLARGVHFQRGSGRGIEVVVQRDDGQKITVAQVDDGDVQLGDRVQIVQDRQGVAKVVRDGARNPD